MIIAIPKELAPDERRVAISPDATRRLVKLGFTVTVEVGAGVSAHFQDQAYAEAGARLVEDVGVLWAAAELVLKVQPPQADEVARLPSGAHLISFIWPSRNAELLTRLAARQATVFAMDCVPRISRAQKLDALSSMANIAGYRAVVEAAQHFGSFFTGQITAAGKIPPARVLVIGAGVAGLSAIGAARGLGAIVRAFDTRPEVREQVKSMGAEFLEVILKEEGAGEGGYAKVMSEAFLAAEMAIFAKQAKEVDIIITTALVPGRAAPVLITAEMVRSMKVGSVIVDLAAEQGGNCALTVPGQVVSRHGVTIIGYTDLASRLPTQASQLYANNVVNLLTDMCKSGAFQVDRTDEVVRGTLVLDKGELTWPPPKSTKPPPAAAKPASTPVVAKAARPAARTLGGKTLIGLVVTACLLLALGRAAPPDFLPHFTVFILAVIVGWQVVWNVTPALHTPLMSVTNAISGIIVVGAVLQVGAGSSTLATALAAVAILIATINVAGGFLVTQRMLNMFRKH